MSEQVERTDLKPWEPLTLSPKHMHVLTLKAGGLRNKEIAESMDLSESRVSVIVNHPDAAPIIARLTTESMRRVSRDVRDMITSVQAEAFGTVVELMRHAKSETVRMNTAFDLLDRGGHKAPEVRVNVGAEITGEAARTIKSALYESVGEYEEPQEIESAAEVLRTTPLLEDGYARNRGHTDYA